MSTELPMVCTCRGDGIREAEDRRLRIFKRMRLRTMSDLTEAIVLSLAFDFSAHAAVDADQWFGVSLATPLVEGGLFIECDHPADGFAALWEWLAERFPDRVSSDPAVRPPSRTAERISETIHAQCARAEADYRNHRSSAHNGPNDCPPCEDCDVLRSLWVSSQVSLSEEWGGRSLDACVEAAFA